MFDSTACLGLSILGHCSYDPASPSQLQFPIGGGISAIAILFLLEQFTDSTAKFRLSIRSWCKKSIPLLFLLAIISIFTAAVLPLIPGQALPLLGYPIFWEILAGLFFIASIIIFLWSAKRPVKFGTYNYKKYGRACYQIIARGEKDELRRLAIEIEHSINPIFNSIKKVCDPNHVPIHVRHAASILELWSDKQFCNAIVNGAFITLFEIIRCAKMISQSEHSVCKNPGKKFISELIKQSMKSEESLLSRENDFSGLGQFKDLTEQIFGDYTFIISDYRPLNAWAIQLNDNKLSPGQIKNYFLALRTSIKTCLKENTFKSYCPNPFLSPFENLFSLTYSMAGKLKNLPENDAFESFPYLILSEISSGFSRIIDEFNDHEIPSTNIDPITYNHLHDSSIYGVVSWGIFKFFEGLSACLANDDLVRGIAIVPWSSITYSFQPNRQIYDRISFHVLDKAKDNLDRLHYPIIIRLIINLDGISEPQESNSDPTLILHNDIMNLLKKNYKKVFETKPEFAKEMLPASASYNETNNILIKKYLGDGTSSLSLE